MMVLSIDYDKTFTRSNVREYVLELRDRGYNICILTYRYDNANFKKYEGKYTPFYNADLWEDLEECGLHRNVVFTNHKPKSEWLNFTEDVLFHLDDDLSVMFDVTHKCKNVIPIQVNSPMWKRKIEKMLENKEKEKQQCCGNWDADGVCKCLNYGK